jgi:nucleoside-diphosphate-sugar epimerase
MTNYLVTGSAGFIGAMVTRQLLADGHRVVGLDNLNNAYDPRMKEYRLRQLLGEPSSSLLDTPSSDILRSRDNQFEFRKMDITNLASLRDLFDQQKDGFAAIINLAARAGVRQSVEDPWEYFNTNLTGTLNLCDLANKFGVKKFLLASTSSVYGADAPYPTSEEAASDRPLQPYAASKKAAEVLCHSYHYLYGLDVSVVRYFTVYGPAGRPDMVMFRFCRWLHEGELIRINGDGEQTRGFTFVDDIARGTIQALRPVGYQIINLGGHETISVNNLLLMMEELIGKKPKIQYGPLHPADMLANYADVSKARQLLGWQPRIGLKEGVSQLVEWYRQERSWAKEINI